MIASDVLILGAFASLSLVAAFALTKFVADSLSQVLALLVTAVVFGVAYLAAERIDVDSWPTLVAGVAVTVAVLGALSAVAGLNRGQRRRLVARARALAPGSRAAQS
jgi:hypothetical protein